MAGGRTFSPLVSVIVMAVALLASRSWATERAPQQKAFSSFSTRPRASAESEKLAQRTASLHQEREKRWQQSEFVRRAKESVEEKWASKVEGVEGIGVGSKIVGGEDTGILCIHVKVAKKLPLSHLEAKSSFILPRFVSFEGAEVPTDVVEAPPRSSPPPSANRAGVLDSSQSLFDPLIGGISLGGCNEKSPGVYELGTLAGTVFASGGIAYSLSNYHVVCPHNCTTGLSKDISQPSRNGQSVGINCYTGVKSLLGIETAGCFPLQPTKSPECQAIEGNADVALVSYQNFRGRMFTQYSLGSYLFSNTHAPALQVGDAVKKVGENSGLTFGTVTSVSFTAHVGPFSLPNTIEVRANTSKNAGFQYSGDSGSFLLNAYNQVVGLMFSHATGSYVYGYAIPWARTSSAVGGVTPGASFGNYLFVYHPYTNSVYTGQLTQNMQLTAEWNPGNNPINWPSSYVYSAEALYINTTAYLLAQADAFGRGSSYFYLACSRLNDAQGFYEVTEIRQHAYWSVMKMVVLGGHSVGVFAYASSVDSGEGNNFALLPLVRNSDTTVALGEAVCEGTITFNMITIDTTYAKGQGYWVGLEEWGETLRAGIYQNSASGCVSGVWSDTIPDAPWDYVRIFEFENGLYFVLYQRHQAGTTNGQLRVYQFSSYVLNPYHSPREVFSATVSSAYTYLGTMVHYGQLYFYLTTQEVIDFYPVVNMHQLGPKSTINAGTAHHNNQYIVYQYMNWFGGRPAPPSAPAEEREALSRPSPSVSSA